MNDILAEIRPALFGLCISGIPLVYFAIKNNKYMIIFFSITFLISGFAFQSIATTDIDFNILIDKLGTVFGTAIGIFIGNLLLRVLSNNKEKQEVSILLVNALKSHQEVFKKIDFQTSTYELSKGNKYIKFYKSEFKNNEAFKISFNRIGVYSKNEIELVSVYYNQLQRYLSHLETLLIANENNKSINIITYNEIKISQFLAQIIGIFCIFNFSHKFIKDKEKYQNYFESNCSEIFTELIDKNFIYSSFFILRNIIAMQMIDKLEYVRDKYKTIGRSLNKNQKPIYICRVSIDIENYSLSSDLEKKIIMKDDYFISFGNSEKESIEKCKELIINTLKEQYNSNQIERFTNDYKFKSHIISPWG